uniref:J domain-containing protein n=1 Tax=Panagrolaimus davidi TaxID=227884 RepID=A0A914QZP8_9BILA
MLTPKNVRLLRQHFVPFADRSTYLRQFRRLAVENHPDRGGQTVFMQRLNDLNAEMSLQNPDFYKRISDIVFAEQQRFDEEDSENISSSSSVIALTRFRKPDRVRCYNCRGNHTVAECPIYKCIFCWEDIGGKFHTCNRKWTLVFFDNVNNYRRQVTSRCI